MTRELSKIYDPHAVEGRLYEEWETAGYFAPRGEGEPFCIVLPPPNVTGALHMGHALDHSIQDAIVRRKRMQGFRTLWLPGTDHAGIATQNVVERELAKDEGTSRHDLGREAFVEKVWEWKRQYGGQIVRQMRRLGDSCDWSRERFTMDEDLSRAVREVFVRLYDEGLIYRGNRIINWCPRCMTALSDIEVEHAEVDGELVELRYPLADGSGEVTIATTRVETMLGDTGVAVHPEDERYRDLIGKTVRLPLIGRELPVVADEAIDREFGTGALKVTPAHDPVDFEIAARHGLPPVNVLAPDGTINEHGGRFAGMDRFEARKAVLEAMRAEGRVGREERPFVHAVGHCQRCHTEVEPWLSEQWFVKVESLARAAGDAVRDGRTRFVPKRFERNYFDWVDNLRDWCISRQLWWGHRIPVWMCFNGHEFAARTDPSACPVCGNTKMVQDEDVLDTWFSSALWPFSTLGWPEQTEDLGTWYPTSVLVTGYDIITFWVARMMMMGLHFLDEPPFRDVNVHGLVRDFRGKKMSKSFGNVINPLEMIDKYGADALRMTLTRSATLGGEVPLDEKWIEGDRNFANKLWNISRFVLMNRTGGGSIELPPPGRRTLGDRWILSRLDAVAGEVDEAMEAYDLARAAQALRAFAWNDLADWYVEWSKGRLYEGSDEEKAGQAETLAFVLERTLRLLHPIMPFLTEEVWRALTGGATIMLQPWPAPGAIAAAAADGASGTAAVAASGTGTAAAAAGERFADPEADGSFAFLQEVVSALRRFRADHQIPPATKPSATAVVGDPGRRALLESELGRVRALAGWGEVLVTAVAPAGAPEVAAEARLVLPGAVIHVPLAGLLDLDAERERLRRERAKHLAEVERIGAKLADPSFTERAPAEVVELQRERLEAERALVARIDEALRDLG